MDMEKTLKSIESDERYQQFSSVFLSKFWGDNNRLGNLVDIASEMSKKSPRGRFSFMIHKQLTEDLHCLINSVHENSYVPPHKHDSSPDRRETFTVVRGHLWIILFDEKGEITQKIKLDANNKEFEQRTLTIETSVMHTVVSDVPFTVLELKQHPKGGYDGKADKVRPEWAPAENDPIAQEYYNRLLKEVKK